MFKTLKIPIELNIDSKNKILDIQRQYSNVFRFAYNRFLDGLCEKEIRNLTKKLESINDLNSWLIQCAILDAKGVFTRFNWDKKNKKILTENKVIFGGKGLLNKLHKNIISKQEFKLGRLRPIDIQGEQIQSGNRMFKLNIQDRNKLVFKLNKNNHIEIPLPNLRNNWLNQLWKLEEQAKQKSVTYSIKLTSTHIYISFDDKELQNIKHIENRAIGIDLNPNHIGVSIQEFDGLDGFKVLEQVSFDILRLTVKSGKASSHKDSKHLHNKLQFETIEITKRILNLCKKWNVKFVFVEDLNFKQQDSGLGTGFNRLTKNKWLKTLFQTQLKKRLDLFGFKLFNVNPAYSSIIGNIQYDSFDPVNAATEICRRGCDVIIRKNKKFYPAFRIKQSFQELWKQTEMIIPDGWTEFFKQLKNSKLKYRVSLDSVEFKVFSQNSKKSKTNLYCFT